MEAVANIECLKCKVSVTMEIRKPENGEASLFVTATNIKLPCGHEGSDKNRWSGNVAEIAFVTKGK